MSSRPIDGIPNSAAQTPPGVFQRFFNRRFLYMALLFVLPVILADTLNVKLTLLRDPDLWWHLADARLLCTTHHFIRIEPYSFAVAGQAWVNPEWLSELPFWFSYQAFGLRGIYLVTWLALAANVLLLFWRGYRRTGNSDASFWAAALGFVLMTVNSGPRTILFGYLALSVEMFLLEAAERGHRRLLWFLPPLFCLWINLHGSWLIGIALLALYCVCAFLRVNMGSLRQEPTPSAERKHLICVFAASIAALIVNPYGWRLVFTPFDMLFNQSVNIANVAEWRPLQVSSLEGTVVVAIIALMVLANLKRSRTWPVFDLAVVLFAWYAAVDHIRFSFLAAVLTVPFLAMDIARSFSSESEERTIPALNALIGAAALCFAVVMYPSESRLQKQLARSFPLQTIRSLQSSWRTFNWDYVGGMMAFEGKPDLVDSRIDTFEHHGVLQNYLAAMNLQDAPAVLDYYRIDHVLVQQEQPLGVLLAALPGWRLVAQEPDEGSNYALFERVAVAGYPPSASVVPATH